MAGSTGDGSDAPLRDERKIVTALFADVAGSTSIGEQLDPEEFRLVIGEAVDRMVRVVQEYGGHVKEIAGDGLLALFGAPTVHEDDAERAVRAALEIAAAIEDYGAEVRRGWGLEDFAVRVGVTTGPVVLGTVGGDEVADYTAYGDTVNTAARLQSAAAPGTVLADATTQRLSGSLFEWSERESLRVKGRDEPVIAHTVLGYRTDQDARDEFIALRSDLVGRNDELGRLNDALSGLERGLGRIIFITGEAGIGKSRLLEELREHGADRGATWLVGHAASYAEATPYWPFRDLIRRWLQVTFDEPDLRVRVRLRKQIERLFPDRPMEIYPYLAAMLALSLEPEGTERLAELSPEALQYRTFEVVGALVSQLAEERPVVIEIEDLHWADPTSVQLLESLLAVGEQAPVLIAVTSRSDPDHHSWELRAGAAREFPHSTEEIELDVLPGDAGRILLEGLVGVGTLPADLERSLLEVAEGNPFYLEELVRSLIDSGALVRDGDGWRFDHEVEFDLPPTVERVILARVDRLPEPTHDVLIGASVLGREFTLPLLGAVTSQREEVLADALHDLQRYDFVRLARRLPHSEYQFKHALIQEAAYRTLLKADRVMRHELAARFLEAQYADNQDEVLGLLAYHWHAADAEDEAIHYLTRAGDKARLEYALDEAIDHYRQLLPLLEGRGDRRAAALVLFKLALAMHMTLRFTEANRIYQLAFEQWEDPESWAGPVDAVLRFGGSGIREPDPRSHFLGDIQLCMALYDRLVEAWPERTIVPSLADRWTISDDGLRYTFHLRDGLMWNDGVPLTAGDVEYGIKRILDPADPGMSVAIYFVLENAQDYYLGNHDDPDRIGVTAIDDRTVEFRLAAPAPYFMWVVNRPDGGPQPRHAFEAGASNEEVARNTASGPFRLSELSDTRVVLERRDNDVRPRPGNVRTVEWHLNLAEVQQEYLADDLDVASSRFAFLSDLDREVPDEGHAWPPAWCNYLVFDHGNPATGNVDFRRALAHAIDRQALRDAAPPPWIVASGGLVPPPLQGHTPDIAPNFDPGRAIELMSRAEVEVRGLTIPTIAGFRDKALLDIVASGWSDLLGLEIEVEELSLETYFDSAEEKYLIRLGGWYPGYADPEYYLRLLLQSDSATNQGGFNNPEFDSLVERARQERSDRRRLELFHEADRLAVADQVAVIPLWYAHNVTFIKPGVKGWWEFGKTWPNFSHLVVED